MRSFAFHAGTFKTRTSVKKRFKVTASGSIVRKRSGKAHLSQSKTRRHINRLGGVSVLRGGIRARYLRVLQIGALGR